MEALRSPEMDLRREALIEGPPVEIEAVDEVLPEARVTYPSPEEAVVTFDGHVPRSMLVLTDSFHPGWKVEVDGVAGTLYAIGGPVIHDFAFALCFGVIIGTYSSIFIASPVLVWWTERRIIDRKRAQPACRHPAGSPSDAGPIRERGPAADAQPGRGFMRLVLSSVGAGVRLFRHFSGLPPFQSPP